MRLKTLLTLAGAAGGTVLATAGVVGLLGDGDDRGSVRAVASARGGQEVREIASVLEGHGAGGCKAEASRVECRYNDRYVAAEVFGGGAGLTVRSALPGWRSGTAQALMGDRGSFAILQGPNWLVTGPDEFVEGVRPELAGQVVYCDSPYSGC